MILLLASKCISGDTCPHCWLKDSRNESILRWKQAFPWCFRLFGLSWWQQRNIRKPPLTITGYTGLKEFFSYNINISLWGSYSVIKVLLPHSQMYWFVLCQTFNLPFCSDGQRIVDHQYIFPYDCLWLWANHCNYWKHTAHTSEFEFKSQVIQKLQFYIILWRQYNIEERTNMESEDLVQVFGPQPTCTNKY